MACQYRQQSIENDFTNLYPEMRSRSVDLPAPDGPIMAISLFGGNIPHTSCRTFFFPITKRIVMS